MVDAQVNLKQTATEREHSMSSQETTTPASARPSRKVFDGLNVPLLGFVAVCFFLPLLSLRCGPINVQFSGMDLATGTDPTVNGSPQDQESVLKDVRKEHLPLDIPLLLIPLAAIAGAILFFWAFARADCVSSEHRALLVGLPAILVVVFLVYSVIGFGIERKIAEQAHGPQMVAVEKTTWFYLGLGASIASLILALGRRYSPRIRWDDWDDETPQSNITYSVGTLHYTKRTLMIVFCWVLWGDFVFCIMENIFPRILRLYMLKEVHASNTSVIWMASIIPQILGVLVCPAVSFRSDRCRSKWGRRIPYIFFTAPFLCLFLAGLGFTPQIAEYLQNAAFVQKLGISPMTATLGVIGFLTVGFCFFNEFVNSIYWYLFADVVPKAFMGRFLGLFRVVSSLGGMAFNYFVFPYSLTHMQWAYGGVALLYLVGFSLMCLKVKEGQYPPVTDVTEHTSVWAQIKIYMKECFSHPIYIFIFLGTGLWGVSGVVTVGADYLATDALHISMTDIGMVLGIAGWGGLLLQYPCGWLSDRFGPIRLTLVSVVLTAALNFAQFFFLHGLPSYITFIGLGLVVGSLFGAASMPMLIALMPESKFGQFCSANGTFRSLVIIAFAPLGAWWLDRVTQHNNPALVDNYRYAFLWVGVCYVLYAITLMVVIKHWQKRGGVHGYVPPGSEGEVAGVGEKSLEESPPPGQ